MKKLYRVKEGRKIAGVCAGLGEYFSIDPTWLRIIFLASSFLGGCGIIVYLVCWMVMPYKNKIK